MAAEARGKADGSAGRPYPTLEAARDALRELRRRKRLAGPVRVLVAPGVYRIERPLIFGPEDGGTAQAPVTWSGHGGRPLISGARLVSGWEDGTINGIPCWQVTLPQARAGRWWFTQLFVNGERRLRARLPKLGFHRFAGVPAAEAQRDGGDEFHAAMSAHYAPGEMHAFRNLEDIEVVALDRWWENHLRVKSIDEATRTVHFETKGWSRLSRDETGRPARYRIVNVAEGCTEPGEWYLDRGTGVLSYIPMPGERKEMARVEAPALDLLLSVQGDVADPARRVCHLRFEFLDLRHADWELPRDNPGALQAAFNVPATVRFSGAEDCALYGCEVSQVAGWGVEVLAGCRRNRVVACALHDLGGGGVKIGPEGGMPRAGVNGSHASFRGMDPVALGWGPCREDAGGRIPGRDRVEPSATTVSDCTIHDAGIIFPSATGVWIGDAAGNRVVHNHIWNMDYSGISFGWTWCLHPPVHACDNRIESNRIHDIGRGVLSDLGGIYTLGRQAGSTIRRNVISGVSCYGYGGHGIYLDAGSSWMRVEENVVVATTSSTFNQGGGRDNLVRRNLFLGGRDGSMRMINGRNRIVRHCTFEQNTVAQGAGLGLLWRGDGCTAVRTDRNVYVLAPGGRALCADGTWEQWRERGHDRRSVFQAAAMLDPTDPNVAVADAALFRAAGIEPEDVAAIVAGAGPRFHGVMPGSIDQLKPEPAWRGPVIETMLWPWPAEWPCTTDDQRSRLNEPGAAAAAAVGQPQPVSITVENRGTGRARGCYRLHVTPASAARLTGPRELKVNLASGGRAELNATLVATGRCRSFSVVADAEGEELPDSCLNFAAVPMLTIPRLPAVPADADLAKVMEAFPSRPVDGNGSLFKASCRLAVAGERLIVDVAADDSAPQRGTDPWTGSCCELYVAPRPGAPRVQAIAVPALDGQPAVFVLAGTDAVNADLVQAGTVVATGGLRPGGWRLVFSVPLAILKLDPGAESFAVDMVVSVRPPREKTLCGCFLSCAIHPFASSTCYARAIANGR